MSITTSNGGNCCKGNNILYSVRLYKVPSLAKMGWIEPRFSLQDVDEAGRILIKPDASDVEYSHGLTVIDNWRSSHAFPLNTFRIYLRRKSRAVDRNSLIIQRLKRLPAIHQKLQRLSWLSLSQMQDIGGCRAVVNSVNDVKKLALAYHRSSLKHRIDDEDDYIENPKPSGYRAYHLIYRYRSDKKETYNRLKIEIQLRSKLQHCWATAVETVDTFTHQSLKSSQGQKDWLRFFALMGNHMALREKTPSVPGTPTDQTMLKKELRECAALLDVETRLMSYGAVLEGVGMPEMRAARYFLFKLNTDARTVSVTGYRLAELDAATDDYLEAELEDKPGNDVVLVAGDSLASLRKAYPNYFADTRLFISEVRRAIS